MNLSVERLPECKARLSAEIPADAVKKTRQSIVAAYASQAKVPGFRPGKIPAGVIEKKFGSDIDSELKDRLARSAYTEAREKEKLTILGIAQIEREQLESDGSYLLAVEVITEPEMEVDNYKGIKVEVPKINVTDEMIDAYLSNMAKQRAMPSDVERAAEAGDLVVVDYTATMEDDPLEEKLEKEAAPLAKGEGHWVDVPSEGEETREFIPGLSDQVLGLSAGDSKTFDATYADDFPVEAVAGKVVAYELTVTQVKEREIPPIDEEFAKSVSAKSLEDLKDNVRKQFKQQQERNKDQVIDNQILSHLNDEMTFDLPEHVVFNETQRQVNQMVSRGYEQGMSESDIEQSQEDLLKSAETQAKNNVKTMFILDEIAEKEGLTVSEEEVSQRIMMIAMQQQRPPKKVAREIRDRNGYGDVRQDILISKTIEFLRENAEITEVDPPEEDA